MTSLEGPANNAAVIGDMTVAHLAYANALNLFIVRIRYNNVVCLTDMRNL